jgi:hypothetical protein
MKVFRYEVKGGSNNIKRIGIINGLYFASLNNDLTLYQTELLWTYHNKLCQDLSDPSIESNIDMHNTKSWFTSFGYMYFKEILDQSVKLLNDLGYRTYELRKFISDSNQDLIYYDNFQVVTRRR